MDALSLVLDKEKLSEVPEDYRSLYVEKEGKLHLDPKALVTKGALREYQDNNRRLFEENKRLTEQWQGVDLEEAKKALEEKKLVREKKLLDAGKVDELLAAREAALKAEHEKRYTGLDTAHKATQAELETTRGALAKELRDATLLRLSGQFDVAEGAKEDVLQYGKDVFQVRGGALVAVDSAGQVVPGVTPESWLKDVLSKKPHWLKPSTGGGTPPKGATGSPISAVGTKPRRQMTTKEKTEFIKAHGQEKFLKLPA